MQWLTDIKDWILYLGKKHHVNPLVFGAFYLVGKVTFLIFIGWTVKNLRAKKPILTILLIALAGYCLPYVYLVIAGRDIPYWIYLFIAGVFVYGGFVVWKKVRVQE